MKRKLMVTGGHGFVAGSVLAQAGPEWEAHSISRSAEAGPDAACVWHACDPLGPGVVAQLFRTVQPAAVIHTAALADIDFCQTHPDEARTVNVELTRTLVEACKRTGARLVFCSTDTVFDGEHAPYAEDAPAGPVNVYAETKAAAEAVVGEMGELGAIARLSLVAGLPLLGAGNSFLVKMLAAFREGRTVAMPEREVRTPVSVITVGRALLELAAGGPGGIFHLAGLTRLTRVDMARRIAARFSFSPALVLPQPAAAMAGRAPRPRDVSLGVSRTCTKLKTPLRPFEEELDLILERSHQP